MQDVLKMRGERLGPSSQTQFLLQISKMKYWNSLSGGIQNNLTLGSTSLHSGLSVGSSGETLPARHNMHLFKIPLRND